MKTYKKKYKYIKLLIMLLVVYYTLSTLFYIVSKEQLYFRDHQLSEKLVQAEIATTEITKDNTIKQTFISNMDRIDSFELLLTTFARKNTGEVQIKLYDSTVNKILYEEIIDVSKIIEGELLQFHLEIPSENLKSHLIVIELQSTNNEGNAVAPMYNSTVREEGQHLLVNDVEIDGTMCFNVYGKNNVWTGPHYWEIVNIIMILLFLYFVYLCYKWEKGKQDNLFSFIESLRKYKFLIKQLILRDFKLKYKRSLLGGLWSFINPLLTMSIQYIIFSSIFKTDIEKYPVYLLTGVVLFNFFQEVTNNALNAIIGNAQLINKVYVPKYIYPMTKTMSSSINLIISMVPLAIMCLMTKVEFSKTIVLVPFILICFIIFCLGISYLLSAIMVFFRDIQFIWSVVTMAWIYATPIFYPESILPNNLKFILDINPIYSYIKFIRIAIIEGISPEPRLYFQCALFSIGSFILGVFVFNKLKDKFIYYI